MKSMFFFVKILIQRYVLFSLTCCYSDGVGLFILCFEMGLVVDFKSCITEEICRKKKNLRQNGPTSDSVSLVLIFAPEQDNIFRLDGIT